MGLELPPYAVSEIARRSKRTARTALLLLQRVFTKWVVAGSISPALLEGWFREMGIDADGLDRNDRTYLDYLQQSGTAGLGTVAAYLGLDRVTVAETIEPFLVQEGFITVGPRGRKLGYKPPNGTAAKTTRPRGSAK